MKLTEHSPWIIASLVLVFLVVTVATLANDVFRQPDVKTEISTITRSLNDQAEITVGEITAGTRVGQTFRAAESGLDKVDVLLATYGRTNSALLLFSLYQYPSGAVPLRTVVVESQTIRDNQYYAFEFAPIADSAGKTFLLTLESPDGVPGDAVTVWLGECDCYPEGTALLNGEEDSERDLAFRVGYHSEVTSVLDELINRVSQYKPWFFKGVPLTALGLFSLGLTLLAVGSFTASLPSRTERRIKWPWVPVASLVIAAVSLWFVLE